MASRRPAFPRIQPTLKNKIELNIDKLTGAKTPLKTPRVLWWLQGNLLKGIDNKTVRT